MCNVAPGKLIAKLMCKGNPEKDEGTEQEEIGTAFVLCSLHTHEGRLGRKASRQQAAQFWEEPRRNCRGSMVGTLPSVPV